MTETNSQHPDLEICAQFVERRPPAGKVLLCSVTGSHHYGFPSPDSDYDLKGIHQAPTRSLLGLSPRLESHDLTEIYRDIECDLTTNELGKSLRLLLSGNGNMLERIFSPFQIVHTPEAEMLRDLAHKAISKKFYGHYAGYFRGMQQEHQRSDPPHIKSMLYTFRVTLTGIHLLRTGQVEANLRKTCVLYGYPDAQELIDRKCSTKELEAMTTKEDQHFRNHWPRLQQDLDSALSESQLPAEPANRSEVEEWLVEQRCRELEA